MNEENLEHMAELDNSEAQWHDLNDVARRIDCAHYMDIPKHIVPGLLYNMLQEILKLRETVATLQENNK